MNRELRAQREVAEENWRVVLGEGASSCQVRPEVFSSWQRSSQRVPIDMRTAPVTTPELVAQDFAQSRLGRACQVILDDLRDVTSGGDMVAALTDETVTISWMVGGRRMLRHCDDVNFTLGGQWGESAVGTNALNLAHEIQRPTTVFSAEHYAPMVHDWVCYSAPILDPSSGRSLGVIDISSIWSRSNPSLLTMVRALARNVEYELARDVQGGGTSLLAGTTLPTLRIRALGESGVWLNGREIHVTRRQFELLVILAVHDRGLSLDHLTGLLYGDVPISLTTVKAELSHLRQILGGVIGSRPYRLEASIDADHVRVLHALRSGDLTTAMDLYRGSLLVTSQSPEIEGWRHQIDVALREAVVRSNSPELLFRFANYHPEDGHVSFLASSTMARDDVRRGMVAGLRGEYLN